jgi:peptidoglycan/xylan/chitin deacetylase (PgdA/CDA1 family)
MLSNVKQSLSNIKGNKILRKYHAAKIIQKMEAAEGNLKEGTIPYVNKSGVVLSFDDSFRVQHWYDFGKELFGFYDVKVTFNINAIHPFENNRMHNQDEIDMLLELQSNGHEIVHHGFKHKNALQYSKQFGINKWVEDDIIPLFDWMEKQEHSITGTKFKKTVSFAFPGSAYNEEIIKTIVPKYFKVARGNLWNDNLAVFEQTGFIPSVCIDTNYFFELEQIKKAINLAKKTGKNLVLMCHSILPEEFDWTDFGWGKSSEIAGKYRISPRVLKEIINEVKRNEMEFYTLAEVSGVANFADKSLEKTMRDKIQCENKWIMIKDLFCITELDLRGKGISNLDGIQYFLELESLDLRDNLIDDYRLLEKLPKLKRILK